MFEKNVGAALCFWRVRAWESRMEVLRMLGGTANLCSRFNLSLDFRFEV